MKKTMKLSLIATLCSSLLLTGCGDAETNIVEKEPEKPAAGDDHGHGGHGDITIDSLGRLAISSPDSDNIAIFDLDDSELLGQFATTHSGSRITASAGYRYLVVTNRDNGHTGFIDGGLWREDHVAHLHDYEQAPAAIDFHIDSSRPTHVVKHDGAMAIFNDGAEDGSIAASVNLLTDENITAAKTDSEVISFDMNMHGVAEPRGDFILTTVRRDDASSTSTAKILPDQVAVYHKHGDEYEQDVIFELTCPNLHGAAQSKGYVAFGCGDGVFLAKDDGHDFDVSKIANLDNFDTRRVGTLYGHHEHDSLIGVASARGTTPILVTVNAAGGEMEAIDWQPQTDAAPVSYGFSAEGDVFVILDNQGYLTLLEQHVHDGAIEWEFSSRVDFTEQDVSTMPDDQNFSLVISQHTHIAYISDPLAKSIVAVDLEDGDVTTALSLDFTPANISWLGIKEEHAH